MVAACTLPPRGALPSAKSHMCVSNHTLGLARAGLGLCGAIAPPPNWDFFFQVQRDREGQGQDNSRELLRAPVVWQRKHACTCTHTGNGMGSLKAWGQGNCPIHPAFCLRLIRVIICFHLLKTNEDAIFNSNIREQSVRLVHSGVPVCRGIIAFYTPPKGRRTRVVRGIG